MTYNLITSTRYILFSLSLFLFLSGQPLIAQSDSVREQSDPHPAKQKVESISTAQNAPSCPGKTSFQIKPSSEPHPTRMGTFNQNPFIEVVSNDDCGYTECVNRFDCDDTNQPDEGCYYATITRCRTKVCRGYSCNKRRPCMPPYVCNGGICQAPGSGRRKY